MKHTRVLGLLESIVLGVVVLATAGCAPVAPATRAATTPAPTALATPTRRPTPTASPTATSISGVEGWQVVNPQDVDIRVNNGALVMTLTHRALWFM